MKTEEIKFDVSEDILASLKTGIEDLKKGEKMNIALPKRVMAQIEEIGLLIVYFFGSSVIEKQTLKSDIDLGIVVSDIFLLDESLKLYSQLVTIFTQVPAFDDREVDIVFLQRASLPLQFEVINTGKVLYEKSPVLRADYEEYVMNHYLDMKPKLDEYAFVTMETFS